MAYPTIAAMIDASPGIPTDAAGRLGPLSPETLAVLIALKEGEGGSAATIADGADVAEGATTNAAVVNPALAGTTIGLMKGLLTELLAILAKQPALGTAGTASSNVLTVQGIASGTAQSVADIRTVTPHFKTLGASGTQVIPIGARGYLATFLTGTGTIGGEVATVGLSVSSSNTLAATVTVATDAASSAFVSWET